jgi:hypothetical protein
MRHQEKVKIIAAPKGQWRTARNLAIGLGNNEREAMQALYRFKQGFRESSQVATLTQRVQEALASSKSPLPRNRIEDPDWDIFVQF